MGKRKGKGQGRPQAPASSGSRPVIPARPALPAADRRLSYAALPLRFFLGVTFIYAGLQKLSDPGFLTPGSSTYIGTQMQAFAVHSPIAFVLNAFALPLPQLTGVGVMVTEMVVGAMVILGLATRWAAVVGALLSFTLFLTASWTVQPYFLGSDSIYTVAWITLALVGDQGVLSLAPALFGASQVARGPARVDQSRRRLLVQLGGAAVGLVWVLAILPRTRSGSFLGLGASQGGTSGGSGTANAPTTPQPSPTPVVSPSGTKIGLLSDLRSQGFLNFNDPTSGDPSVAVSLSGGSVVAFDAVCTHAGCIVAYDPNQKLLACPCHGALYDPAHGAEVVAGPAPTPLTSIALQVGADGGVYAS